MFFVYGVYNNSLEMMFIRLGLLTRKVCGIKQSYPEGCPKETRYGALRRCGSAHGSVEAECMCGGQYPKRWRLYHNGRRSL